MKAMDVRNMPTCQNKEHTLRWQEGRAIGTTDEGDRREVLLTVKKM